MLKSPYHIVLVGTSFRTAPVEIRERLSRSVSIESLRDYFNGERTDESFAVLSTCNRVEICASTKHTSIAKTRLKAYLTHLEGEVKGYLYSFSDMDAIKHLFRVACGMDSMVLGEPQILLQVKHADKVTLNGTGEVIEKLLHQAYSAGRRIRRDAEIDSDSSISSAAVDLIRSKLGNKPSLLILGGGKMAVNAFRNLKREEFGEIYIANRTPSRVDTTLLDGIRVHSLQEAPSLLSKVDAAIVVTSSPTYIVTRETLKDRKSGKGLLLVDLSIPRNVDPSLAGFPDVALYNIDDLASYAETELDREQLIRVEQLISKEAGRYASWLLALGVAPVVRSIRTKAEEIRRDEMKTALKRLSGVRERDAEVLSALSSNIVNRLLHEPTVRLREHAKNGDATEYGRIFMDLFGIDD